MKNQPRLKNFNLNFDLKRNYVLHICYRSNLFLGYFCFNPVCFLMSKLNSWVGFNLPFLCESDRKKRKTQFHLRMSRLLCVAKHSWMTLRFMLKQTIIWRQLFADHVVGSWPIKRKKNLHQMIIKFSGACHFSR